MTDIIFGLLIDNMYAIFIAPWVVKLLTMMTTTLGERRAAIFVDRWDRSVRLALSWAEQKSTNSVPEEIALLAVTYLEANLSKTIKQHGLAPSEIQLNVEAAMGLPLDPTDLRGASSGGLI